MHGVPAADGEVGTRAANAWGLKDMYGNVYEWTFDWFDDEFYKRDEAKMTNTANKNTSSDRVLRGGSFIFPAVIARSAVRYWFAPGYMVC